MSVSFNVDQLPFSVLTEAEKALLLSHIQYKEYQPLDALITAGEPAQGVFVLHQGRVAESEPGAQTDEQLMQQQSAFMHYQAGEYFGS